MKKEVSPAVVVVLVLVALTVAQLLYFRGLVGGPAAGGGGGGGGGGGRPPSRETPPAGVAEVAVATLAGAAEPGYRDGTASVARFNGPAAVALAADGSVYVADSRNHVIRKVSKAGRVSTFAGAADRGLGGFADGPAGRARFAAPAGLAVLPGGDLLVADTGNNRIRRVSKAGTVTTLAGADTRRDELGRPTGGYRDGAVAQAQFRYPAGLAVGGDGTVYVADAGNHCVRRIAGGVVSTLAAAGGKMETPTQLALIADRLWVVDSAKPGLWVGPPSGPLRWQALAGTDGKPLERLAGIAAGERGTYLLDAGVHCLLRVDGGTTTLLAGQRGVPGSADGTGDIARFAQPVGLVPAAGALYVADFGNNSVRKVTAAAAVQ